MVLTDCVKTADLVLNFRMFFLPLLALALLTPALLGLAQAQQASETPQVKAPPPAYDPQLIRLSQLLGSIHYLQRLCQPATADTWRDQMNAVLLAEQPDEERKARMVVAFNKGFHSYAAVHRKCSPSARAIISQYMREGEQLTRTVVSRFGQ